MAEMFIVVKMTSLGVLMYWWLLKDRDRGYDGTIFVHQEEDEITFMLELKNSPNALSRKRKAKFRVQYSQHKHVL